MPSSAEWDERFRSGSHSSSTPDPFLTASCKYWPLLSGWNEGSSEQAKGLAAIDLACGAGRHAVELAKAGFSVTAIDFSAQALTRGRALAEKEGVAVNFVEKDLEAENVDLGEGLYELAAVFFYLERPLLPSLRRCLKPGGLVIYKTYSVDQLRYPGRPRHRVHMLEHNELLRIFKDFRVLHYEEEWEGRGTSALIARKP